ncbi:TIR domain-containing protein [Dongia sp.]|uniref:TIR domain-containing protein n=1 Tax=Dongia sp. TaxID=1977262 RepID=UPI0035B3A4C8
MFKYQAAVSFAGEQRLYVEQVVRSLQSFGVPVFYDGDSQVTLWGKDGVEFFHQLFSAETSYVVMFISKEYVDKPWCSHERRSALSRALMEKSEYVLPVRFDDTPVPGMPSTIQYLDANKLTPYALATLIVQKLGISPFATKASDVPPPHVTSSSGTITFDYSSYNGVYILGRDPYLFETHWSKSSDTSIQAHNDKPSIHGIAVAVGAHEISDIGDAATFDFSSAHRRPQLGQILILRNTNGFYAATKILAIVDNTRGLIKPDKDEMTFEFVIQIDGTASFVNARISEVSPNEGK